MDECSLMPSICGTAVCKNIPGDFECECPDGYRYDPSSKSCKGRMMMLPLLLVERVGLNPGLIFQKNISFANLSYGLVDLVTVASLTEVSSKTHGLWV